MPAIAQTTMSCALLVRSVPPHSIARADPVSHRVQEVSKLEWLRQMEFTVGFEFRQVGGTAGHQEIRDFVRLGGVQGGKRRTIREKHFGNEQVDFNSFKSFERVSNTSGRTDIIFLFLETSSEHRRKPVVGFE
jgi:hypothetical protein